MESREHHEPQESVEPYSYAKEAAPYIAAALHSENLQLLGLEREALVGVNFFDLDGGQRTDAPEDEDTDEAVFEILAGLEDESVDVMLETRGMLRGNVGNLGDLYSDVLMHIKLGGSLYVLNPFPQGDDESDSLHGEDAVEELKYVLAMQYGMDVKTSLTSPEPDALPVLHMQRLEEA